MDHGKNHDNKCQLKSIQALRGLAVLMVLLYHVKSYETKNCANPIMGSFFDIGAAGVDLFFVISGFVMMTITNRSSYSIESPIKFLLKRAIRIYPLYWFYTFIAIAILTLFPNLANRHGGVEETSILKSIFLIPQQGAPIVGQGWTLIHEMYFYAVFAGFIFLKIKIKFMMFILWAIIVSIFTYNFSLPTHHMQQDLKAWISIAVHPLTLEFISGCFIVYLYKIYDIKWGKLVFFAGLALLLLNHQKIGYDVKSGRELFYGFPSFLIVLGAVKLERDGYFNHLKFLRNLGDASYSIYLSHILCLSGCVLIYKFLSRYIYINNYVLITVMLISSIIFGLISYKYIERPMMFFIKEYFTSKKLI